MSIYQFLSAWLSLYLSMAFSLPLIAAMRFGHHPASESTSGPASPSVVGRLSQVLASPVYYATFSAFLNARFPCASFMSACCVRACVSPVASSRAGEHDDD